MGGESGAMGVTSVSLELGRCSTTTSDELPKTRPKSLSELVAILKPSGIEMLRALFSFLESVGIIQSQSSKEVHSCIFEQNGPRCQFSLPAEMLMHPM
jgi:hypothetical protein